MSRTSKPSWWTSSKRSKHGRSPSRRPARGIPAVEWLEDRTLLSVTASLQNGLLDIGLGAQGDSATVVADGTNVQVSDGTNTVLLTAAVGAVTGIDAKGTGDSSHDLGQSVTFTSTGALPLDLSGGLQASGVADVTLNGAYSTASASGNTAGSVNVAADAVTFAAGAVVSTRQLAPGALPLAAASTGSRATSR